MKTMRYFLALLLFIAMLATIVACGGKNADQNADETEYKPYELVYSSKGDGTCTVSDIRINDQCQTKFVLEIPATSPDGEKVVAVEPTRFYSNVPKQITKADFEELMTKLLRACGDDVSLLQDVLYSEEPLAGSYDVKKLRVFYMYVDLDKAKTEEIKQSWLERYPICEQQPIWAIDSAAIENLREQRTLGELLLGRIQYTSFDCYKAHQATGYTQEGVLGGEYVSEIRLGSDDIKAALSLYSTCLGLEKLTLPKGITVIPANEFNSCTYLKEVVISEGTVTIGAGAFLNCTNLTTVTIPYSVTGIEDGAFKNCDNLRDVYYQGTNQEWKAIEKAEEWRGSYTIHFLDQVDREPETNGTPPKTEGSPETDSEGWTIKKKATCLELGEKTRYNKEINKTESQEIPATGHNVKNDQCTVCGKEASQGMIFELNSEGNGYILTEVGSCLDDVGVFSPDIIVGDVIVPSTYKGLPVVEIGALAFAHNSRLEQIYIPDSVVKIGNNAFAQCRDLRYVTCAEGVTSLDYGAFYQCYKLEKVNIPSGVTYISKGLFQECESLESIVIPTGVKTIDDDAFWRCTKLNDIVIPEGVTTIGKRAFAGCENFESVQIPNSVTEIRQRAFAGCKNIKSVDLPDELLCISAFLFSDCTNLYNIELPAGITEIETYAFERAGIVSITIPASVTELSADAFKDCPYLTSVVFENCEGWNRDVSDSAANAKKLQKGSSGVWQCD